METFYVICDVKPCFVSCVLLLFIFHGCFSWMCFLVDPSDHKPFLVFTSGYIGKGNIFSQLSDRILMEEAIPVVLK